MKRGTLDHPKMLHLARLLNVQRWGAVGILESMWHFTSRHAIQGNLGRWSDEQIAEGVGWIGDAVELIAALTQSGWLDRDAVHRLLVHDWHDHADESVRKTLKNRKLPFLTFLEDSRSVPPTSHPSPEESPQPEPRSDGIIPPSEAFPKPKPEPCHIRAVAEPLPMPTVGEPEGTSGGHPVPDAENSEISKSPDSGSDSSASASEYRLPGAANFAATVGVRLRLADIGATPQGKADVATFSSLYQRHILPGHLGPPAKAVKLCYAEALRIGEDKTRTNRASTFLGCMKKHLAKAGFEWDE